MGRAIGIDLGTTNTVVAWADSDGLQPPSVFAVPQLVTATEVGARELFSSCLYATLPDEAGADPGGEPPWVAGEYARRRGTEVPGRFVASAKSWLCHQGVDRYAAILPWGSAQGDVPKISPVDASARYLVHLRRAWDAAHPAEPMAEQDVILTVPASFDEVARELTLEAARRAGLEVHLLEEPQAAFYDFLSRRQATDLALDDGLTLVVDVGGGTTDLSLVRASRGDHGVLFNRVAVGRHILLGGDNMDLALAHLCEPRLVAPPNRLDPERFGQLVAGCRVAKEKLLQSNAPDSARVTVLGHGSRLLGSALSTDLSREEVERTVLEGFFPESPGDAPPRRSRSGLLAFGLPYEQDLAITRHLADFFKRHSEAAAGPTALLLNGGVFHASRVVERMVTAIQAWGGPALRLLPISDPHLAVARGAVAYALARRGHGSRIGGGLSRGYYVGLADPGGTRGRRKGVCVVPRGTEEGERRAATDRTLALAVGRTVRFDLYASDARTDAPGAVVDIDEEQFEALPPIAVALEPGSGGRQVLEVPVVLEGELSAIGTLDLWCVEVGEGGRRYRLAFELRGSIPPPATSPPADLQEGTQSPPTRVGHSRARLEEACNAIDHVFGKGRVDVSPRAVKDLSRELERLLGERSSWTTELSRTLFDAMTRDPRSRKRSPDHERVFWQLAGFCLRPGFGHPLDPGRAGLIGRLFAERVLFPDETRTWQQFWIAYRRSAAGLDEGTQVGIRDVLDPMVAPEEKRLKKSKGWRAEAADDLLELVSSLERVPPSRRAELGGWILDRTWTARDPRLWAAIGKVGARVPAYASIHHVVAPGVVERWIDHLLRERWDDLPTAAQAAVRMARVTGDRARDVSPSVRTSVARRLATLGAKAEWVAAVKEYVPEEETERAAFFGESLPVGLRLVP